VGLGRSLYEEVKIMEIREVQREDLQGLLVLYTQLHDNEIPEKTIQLQELWERILEDKNHHILVGVEDEQIICSVVLVVIPNLTHEQRPYALIENVVTHGAYRHKGYATRVLEAAKEKAKASNCYKMMLLTGSKLESTLKFYEHAGYNREDKTAFIQWL